MERQYIYSERAHFMCPNMHFGIILHLKKKMDLNRINRCIDILSMSHPFLRSVIRYEENSTQLYYDIMEKSMVEVNECTSIESLWEDYRKIGTNEWNVFLNGLLKVYTYPYNEEMKVLFVAHHLLGDGRCLLGLVEEFSNLYVEDIIPTVVEERTLKSINDLPQNSALTGISKYLINRLNKQWAKENHKVSYQQYAKFSEKFVKENQIGYELLKLSNQEFQAIYDYCKENEITINDFIMTKMYLHMNTSKIILAADIRNKINCYQKGACGNYLTALGIVCKNKERNFTKKAKYVHRLVNKQMISVQKQMLVLACYFAMNRDLLDAVVISTLGEFDSKSAKFVGTNIFGFLKREGICLTNLGKIENKNIDEATFIPPASPSASQTIGVLTVNKKLHICCSFYENNVTSKEVRIQLNKMKSYEEN